MMRIDMPGYAHPASPLLSLPPTTNPLPHTLIPPAFPFTFQSPPPTPPMAPQQQQYTQLADQLVGRTIDAGTMQLASILGVGAFGALFRGHVVSNDRPSLSSLPTDRTYAIKCIMVTNPAASIDNSRYANSEYRLHTKCSPHPNVVTLHRVVREQNLVYLIMDYYEDGDLFNMITEKQVYLGRTEYIRHAILQVIDALGYCHAQGVYHRDLKPENILCRRPYASSLPHIVLADFGLATDHDVCWDSGVGSMYYMSPECQGDAQQPKHRRNRFRVTPYTPASHDTWSLGVLLINLACGRNPWKKANTEDNTFACYLQKPATFLMEILPISHELNDILRRIFVPESQRISLQELRAMVLSVKRFTLSGTELDAASSVIRSAAGPTLIARAKAEDETIAAPARAVEYEYTTDSSDIGDDDVDSLLDIAWPVVPGFDETTLPHAQASSDDNIPGLYDHHFSYESSSFEGGATPAVTSGYDISRFTRFYDDLALKEPTSLIPSSQLRVINVSQPVEPPYHNNNVVDLDEGVDAMSLCPSGSLSFSSSDRSPSQGSNLEYPLTPECGPLNSPTNVRFVSPSASPIDSHSQLPSPTPSERSILWKAARYMSSMDLRGRNHHRSGRTRGLAVEAGPRYSSSAAVAAAKHRPVSPQQKKQNRNSFIKSLIKT